MSSLDLWPIGNCQVSALIDRSGCFVWGCVPRVDGDPIFSTLLSQPEKKIGFWSADLEGCSDIEQGYLRNTAILRTVQSDQAGNAIEILDFCPRFRRSGRTYRPVAFVRIIRPIAGSPRVKVKLRPAKNWGEASPPLPGGSNHLRFQLPALAMRLTTDAPISLIREERVFRVDQPLHFFLGPDESFVGDVSRSVKDMLFKTQAEWRDWVRGLATPLEWQSAVIRAAISLKLCQHEETGAIVAALTTSIPEHDRSERNWDYRYCWIRDAYYTVQALNRLGALDVLEGYLAYLRNIVDAAKGGHIQPLYGVTGEPRLEERIAPGLAGYRGLGPVRIGNQAYEQVQHDAYGQIVLSNVQAFFDQRL
ncbi:MAG TPA: glycoside hydrolase family 15 protein, partial [Sphingomicrobium sp.]|nr:glycoside hydrolase family 15 protein [Sphingomicrobium sp.]